MKHLLIVILACLVLSSCAHKTKSPLHEAIYQNDVAAVRALIDEGADVNAIDAWGYPPIVAAVNKSVEITAYLIGNGADISKYDASRNTALHYASLDCDLARARYLIENGANVAAKNANRQTYLISLAHCKDTPHYGEQMKYILSAPENNVFEADAEGKSFYSIVIDKKNLEAIAAMRKAGRKDSYYQHEGYSQAELTDLPNFYTPPEGTYQVNDADSDFYFLALEDCNRMFISNKKSRVPKKFHQCMETMGFKQVKDE
jgi:hypothetical protein